MKKLLLEVSCLNLYLETKKEKKKLLNQISFKQAEEEIVGLVGASGSGKSLFANFLADLLPRNIKIEGEIFFNGHTFPVHSKVKRNQEIALIFQNPATSLNPTMKIKSQISEAICKREKISNKEALLLVISFLHSLSLDPDFVLNSYPHELSGGMQQRVAIAIALAKKPKLLIADEPTTSLDQPLQKETLDLLKEIIKKNKIACLFITHNLSLLNNFCEKISVMHEGQLVEQNTIGQIFSFPKHDYTKALVDATFPFEVKSCNL